MLLLCSGYIIDKEMMKLPKIDEKFLPPQLFAKLLDSNIVFYISQQHFGITSSFFVVIPPSVSHA